MTCTSTWQPPFAASLAMPVAPDVLPRVPSKMMLVFFFIAAARSSAAQAIASSCTRGSGGLRVFLDERDVFRMVDAQLVGIDGQCALALRAFLDRVAHTPLAGARLDRRA